jgi:hypothetical protein
MSETWRILFHIMFDRSQEHTFVEIEERKERKKKKKNIELTNTRLAMETIGQEI